MHEILRGPHFAAITYGPSAARALKRLDRPSTGAQLKRIAVDAACHRADCVLTDPDHIFRSIYGLTGDTLLLIRPDGYPAHIATGDFLASTRSVLRILIPRTGTHT